MKNPYDDILELPHHVSPTRLQMSMLDRAAQFSPFAALTGFDAAIRETGRLTDAKIELGEEGLSVLNRKFRLLLANMDRGPEVKITYFREDPRKEGGTYLKKTGMVKKLDQCERVLTLGDGTQIPLDDILELESILFSELEA